MAISCSSQGIADLQATQAQHLDSLRLTLHGLNIKDIVPILVARNVLKSYEMGAVYSKDSIEAQVDALIALLKTKSHWIGPLTDALIRNGQAPVAKKLLELQANA